MLLIPLFLTLCVKLDPSTHKGMHSVLADVSFTLLAGFHNTFSFHTSISRLWGLVIRLRSSSEMTTFLPLVVSA
jgi:hypothetical protein